MNDACIRLNPPMAVKIAERTVGINFGCCAFRTIHFQGPYHLQAYEQAESCNSKDGTIEAWKVDEYDMRRALWSETRPIL
jgi:hypothetical protein